MIFPATSGDAASGEAIAVTYEIDVSGLRALEINFRMDLSAAGYRSRAVIDPQGLVAVFSDTHTEIGASGEFVDGKATPAAYSTVTEKSGKEKNFTVTWSNDGIPEPHDSPVKNPRIQAAIAAALNQDVVDPLTTVLRLGAESADNPCASMQRVYSGRDVFELSFNLERRVTFGANANGVYRGPAYECTMEYHPIAGRDAEKAKKTNAKPWVVKIWFAPVESAAFNGPMLLPVAANGTVDGKRFNAYATRATIAGQAFNKLSRAGE